MEHRVFYWVEFRIYFCFGVRVWTIRNRKIIEQQKSKRIKEFFEFLESE